MKLSSKKRSPKKKRSQSKSKGNEKKKLNEMFSYTQRMLSKIKMKKKSPISKLTTTDNFIPIFYIYTLAGCVYCDKAKELLKRKHQNFKSYEFKKLTKSEQKVLNDKMKKANHNSEYRYYPRIFFVDKFIGGFD